MDIQASLEQVAGILMRANLHFQTHRDGRSYRLLFGHDAVFIHFGRWGDGVRVHLSSPALDELDREDPGYAVLLNRLNEFNKEYPFVKWMVEDEMLIASHDLLGDELRACEVVGAVHTMTRAVRMVADEFADVTGGRRYDEFPAEDLEEVEDE